jgi:hypothetical protein
MNTENLMSGLKLIGARTRALRAAAGALALSIAVASCGGGAPTVTNPVTQTATVQNYTGPAPANADVQSFQVNLWANIKASNRCGGCHTQGGQSPQFARSDDVNLAYQAANTVVNLQQPDQSLMVQKVSGGHNCWLASPQACGDELTVWISNWAGATATGSQQIQLVAPNSVTVGASKSFPADPTLFSTTVYPIVRQYCARCHSDNAASPQQPFFASADVNEAYQNAQPKMDLANPAQSRFVVRLGTEHHNCWSDCTTDAGIMQAAIQSLADQIPLTPIDPTLVVSKALTLYDGTVASGQNRYTDAQIALYEFKTGTGNIAYDTSGVEPELDLTMSGNVSWVQGWGINIGTGGKAQGTTTASAKLYDLITSTGEFSIEAWVNNANVAQANADIVSYSGGAKVRDMTLAQNQFQYESYARSSVTDDNGSPALATNATNQVAQAALQHVVLTYDPVNGRKLYVNGVFTGDVDSKGGGTLANWDDTFALVLGSEVSNTNQWTGVLQMVAIHNRALTQAQIQQNFNAGVGEKYFLLFDVSSLTNVPQSYIMMTASLNDNYSYLFTNPTFISLDSTQQPNGIPIAGIRIGVNGAEIPVGQTYIPLSTTITSSAYHAGSGQLLSNVGAVIPLENGPASDQFFLSFAQIGSNTHTYTDPPVSVQPPTPGTPVADLGVRTFERLAQTMAKLTGISMFDPNVSPTYTSVQQSLPGIPDLDAFSSSNQTAISQLAISYCSAMVNNSTARTNFFGSSFDPTQGGSYFSNQSNVNTVVNALYSNLVGNNIATQPTSSQVSTELDSLITTLTPASYASTPNRSGTVAMAACAALLGSASTLIQ